MTIEEFKNTRFGAFTRCEYKGQEYGIASVDFEEDLIAIDEFPDDEDAPLNWKRCENITIISNIHDNMKW